MLFPLIHNLSKKITSPESESTILVLFLFRYIAAETLMLFLIEYPKKKDCKQQDKEEWRKVVGLSFKCLYQKSYIEM